MTPLERSSSVTLGSRPRRMMNCEGSATASLSPVFTYCGGLTPAELASVAGSDSRQYEHGGAKESGLSPVLGAWHRKHSVRRLKFRSEHCGVQISTKQTDFWHLALLTLPHFHSSPLFLCESLSRLNAIRIFTFCSLLPFASFPCR